MSESALLSKDQWVARGWGCGLKGRPVELRYFFCSREKYQVGGGEEKN
jgi:hypothetical protein